MPSNKALETSLVEVARLSTSLGGNEYVMEWLSRIVDLAKIPTRLFAVVVVASGLVLFLPQKAVQRIGVVELRADYTGYLGIAFIVSVSLLAVEVVLWAVRKAQKRARRGAAERAVEDAMLNLDGTEKAVLREFLIAGSKTLRLPLEQAPVASLRKSGIVRCSAEAGVRTTVGTVFALSLSAPAQRLLSPDIVDLGQFLIHTEDGMWDLTEEGKEWLRNNRPHFMPELEHHFSVFEKRLPW